MKNPQQASGANNQPVVFIEASTGREELEAVCRIISDIMSNKNEESKRIAVVHFYHETLNAIGKELEARHVDFIRIKKDKELSELPDFTNSSQVLLSTISSLKGLEVDYIIFPWTDRDRWRDDHIMNNMLFVLFTRARKRIYCSYANRHKSFIYSAVVDDGNNDFYQFVTGMEIIGNGNPTVSDEEIDEVIKQHFDDFNI